MKLISLLFSLTGVINTELTRHMNKKWWGKLMKPFSIFYLTPLQGAQTSLYAALEPSIQEKSGAYFSDCKETNASRRALVEKDQDRLWEISEKLVGISE